MHKNTASLDEQLMGGLAFMRKLNAGDASIKTGSSVLSVGSIFV